MPEPTAVMSIRITLPSQQHCRFEGCTDSDLKGRGLCPKHYLTEWSRSAHVFHPTRDRVPLEKVRIFFEAEDVPRIDKLAKTSGYSRSEWVRMVVKAVLNAAE